ncbi:MAG: hypothetical protein ACREKS_21785 [Candidatus Rokuibacteriota bacterium]
MKHRRKFRPVADVRRSLRPGLTVALLAGVLVGAAFPWPAATQAAGEPSLAVPAQVEIPTAPVEIDGRMLFRVRGATSFPAEQRAAAIQERIEAAARDRQFQPTALREVESEGAIAIMAGDRMLMGVFDADARMEQLGQKEAARLYRERIRSAIEDYRGARRPEVLLRGVLYALGAAVVLAALIVLVLWLARRLDAAIAQRLRRHIRAVGIQSFQVLRAEHIWGGCAVLWVSSGCSPYSPCYSHSWNSCCTSSPGHARTPTGFSILWPRPWKRWGGLWWRISRG